MQVRKCEVLAPSTTAIPKPRTEIIASFLPLSANKTVAVSDEKQTREKGKSN